MLFKLCFKTFQMTRFDNQNNSVCLSKHYSLRCQTISFRLSKLILSDSNLLLCIKYNNKINKYGRCYKAGAVLFRDYGSLIISHKLAMHAAGIFTVFFPLRRHKFLLFDFRLIVSQRLRQFKIEILVSGLLSCLCSTLKCFKSK